MTSRTTSRLLGTASVLLAACAPFAACSANDTHHDASSSGLGNGGSAGAPGTGGIDVHHDGGDDGPLTHDGACAATHAQAKLVPLDMAVLIDRSGSMNQDMKWVSVTNALKTFVQDPTSNGISFGLSFFPTTINELGCDYHDYETLVVPIAPLPGNTPVVVSKLNQTQPGGNTPMWAGLKGTLLYTTGYLDTHPNHKVILVFASDGVPGSCVGSQNDISTIADVVKQAHDYDGLETYVIAIQGTDLPSLDALAAAAGTNKAYDVTLDPSQFSQKIAEIRGAALPCNFDIPPPPDGQALDPGRVNVDYTQGGQHDPETIPGVGSASACGNGEGWYYGPGHPPKTIVLCPTTCGRVQGDPGAKVEVLFGCTTVVP